MFFIVYIFYAALAISIGYSNLIGTEDSRFIILTVLLLGYNILELIVLKRKQPTYFYINPVVIGVFFTFFLALGGLSNFFSIEDGVFQIRDIAAVLENEREWLNIALTHVCLASMFCWIGYKSTLGEKLFNWVTQRVGMKAFYDGTIGYNTVFIFAIFAYIIKFYLFSIGLYGRVLDAQFFDADTGYKAGGQLRVFGNLSYLTFLLICIGYFSNKTQRIVIAFWVSLCLEVFFGFIYGARGPFILPFLILFVAKYYVSQKIRPLYILLGLGSLLLAITLVLDFKNYVQTPQFVRSPDPIETIKNFIEYKETKPMDETAEIKKENGLDFSTIPEAAMAIRYKSQVGLSEDDPQFVSSLILFPYNAFVPKFIQGDREPPWGEWFKNVVLKYQLEGRYSISTTPIGFLYFAGGSIMVFIGFFLYGILLKFNLQYLSLGIFGFITFISMLQILQTFDSVVSGSFTNITREAFIFPIIYYFFLRKRPKELLNQ